MPVAIHYSRHFNPVLAGAPAAAFTLGTQVGVPTGTSLTPTEDLPSPDATETITLTHPVTGATRDVEVLVWQDRLWTDRLSLSPGVGETYLFRRCEWDVTGGGGNFFAVDVDPTNGAEDQMEPLVIMRDCTLLGTLTDRVLHASHMWLERTHVEGTDDAWYGMSHSVAAVCNFIARAGAEGSHCDAVQSVAGGNFTLWRPWMEAEEAFPEAAEATSNAALRIGTDVAAIDGVTVRYAGLSGGGYSLQVRGDPPLLVSNVDVQGCRWLDDARFGPVDFGEPGEVTDVTWSDNAYVLGGDTITSPV